MKSKVLFLSLLAALFCTFLLAPSAEAQDARAPTFQGLDQLLKQSNEDSQNISFGHRVLLQSTPNELSRILVTTPDTSVVSIRALLELDGVLLALPLNFSTEKEAFYGSFPTPTGSLRYQLQFIRKEKTDVLSPIFEADSACADSSSNELLAIREKFPNQRALLTEALKLDERNRSVRHAIEFIASQDFINGGSDK